MSDLIDRQDAIDAIHKAFSYAYCDNCENDMDEELCGNCHRKYQNWSASKKVIENVIGKLPTVDRPTGKWLEKGVEDRPIIEQWQSARCSACGKYHTTPYMYYFNVYKFCPHCGAKMEVEHEAD